MKTPSKLLTGFLLVSCIHLFGQGKEAFQVYNTKDGLSQGVIYDILQDQEGFIWIGTKDGLNRFDGYEFKIFAHTPSNPFSISGNTINRIFEDSSGRIWAAVDNVGISIFDKKTGRFHHIPSDPEDPSTLSGSYITGIVEDTSGYFVVGIEGKELNLFKLEDDFFTDGVLPKIVRIAIPAGAAAHQHAMDLPIALAKDGQGRIWVSGNNNIYHLQVRRATLELKFPDLHFTTSTIAPDGSLLMNKAHSGTIFRAGKELANYSGFNAVREMQFDQEGRLWIVDYHGILAYDLSEQYGNDTLIFHDSLQVFKHVPTGNQTAPPQQLLVDRSGTVWVGTNGLGLLKINPASLHFEQYLPGTSIRYLTLLNENKLAIGGYHNWWLLQQNKLFDFSPLPFDPWEHNYPVASTRGGYWILYYADNLSEYYITKFGDQQRVDDRIRVDYRFRDFQPMLETRDGSLWMAGFNKVVGRIDPDLQKFTVYDLSSGQVIPDKINEPPIFSQEYTTVLYEDADGFLWVGTETGLYKCTVPDQQEAALEVVSYRNTPGAETTLSYNHITSIIDDHLQPQRYLWVGTRGGGVNRLDKKSGRFRRFGLSDGLPNQVIYGLLTDDQGNLWGSTNNGLFCTSPSPSPDIDGAEPYPIKIFTKADGLQEDEFNLNAFQKLADGRLAFGGINGLTIFDPQKVLAESYQAPVFITGILVNNKEVGTNDSTGVLTSAIELASSITLDHRQDILTLEYAALDYHAPVKNKYRYQLLGVDDDWVEAGTRRSATFLHLSPGTYTFSVQGANSHGEWSSRIGELEIRVLPPWWRSWWAYLIYISLIAAAIWNYVQFRINREKLNQQLLFEKKEAERVRELDTLKSRLFVNMTHEFRTPLTVITGMAQQVMEDPATYFRDGMDMILRNGQGLLNLVNKMLHLSKLENGKMTLDLSKGEIIHFCRQTLEGVRALAAQKNIQLHFLPEINAVTLWFDPEKLQQVLSNVLSNACKFTPADGHIYFSLARDQSTVTIKIKDTGPGIPLKEQEQIFDRFYQVDDSSTRLFEGSGIGLALCKELMQLMEGQISVESPPKGHKQGAEFSIRFPAEVADEAITPEEVTTSSQAPDSGTSVSDAMIPSVLHQAAASPETPTDKPCILLVEDNRDVLSYLASCLTDYQLLLGFDGQEGFQLATEAIPDLIISDVMMPKMDGFELCQALKADLRTNHIPIVMLTARADFESKMEGLESGANAYLAKPFEKKELLLVVQNIFQWRDQLWQKYRTQHPDEKKSAKDSTQPVSIEPEHEFVLQVRTYIESHLGDFDLSVEKIARDFHLSHSQFGRKLDALTGLSPNKFVKMMRLEKAKKLLVDPALSITEVAYDCGFNDPSYFARVFKKETGLTPVEWRSGDFSRRDHSGD